MFDFIKKLFGDGVVHFTFECTDGRTGKGKINYIGEYNKVEVLRAIKQKLLVEENVMVNDLEIIARYEK